MPRLNCCRLCLELSIVWLAFFVGLLPLFAPQRCCISFTHAYSPAQPSLRKFFADQLRCLMNREGKEGDDVNANSLKAKAAKLREEVELLEQEAKRRRTPSSGTGTRLPEAAKLAPEPSQYNAIEDSVWQLSYRFSDRPEPRPDADDQRTGQQQPRKFYSGKLTLKFRSDGYTDVISQESLGSSTDAALVTKVWGWDLEKLNEDGKKDAAANVEKEFLLFSADFDIPSIDVKDGATKIISQRFYFQARQTKEKQTNIVSLSEGTVTVKQDIVQKSARWGLFSPAGILAQFRYVGDFVSKPVRIPEQNDSR